MSKHLCRNDGDQIKDRAIYVRQSSCTQRDASIEDQIADIKEFCKQSDFHLIRPCNKMTEERVHKNMNNK